MKKLRILVLMHPDLVPPETLEGQDDREIVKWKTEFDVVGGLRDLGHEVQPLGVLSELEPVREALDGFRPDVVFNLLEGFNWISAYDQHVISYLELLGQRYTGCNPRGMVLARDKALAKKILAYHHIRSPGFCVCRRNRKIRVPARLSYPMIVKSLAEEASYGIAQASVVHDEEELRQRVEFLHEQLDTHALVEEYIDGRELYVSVIGNDRLTTYPPMELVFGDLSEKGFPIATSKVKFDWAYQERHGIDCQVADLDPGVAERLARLGRRIYRRLGLSGYARIDFRVRPEGDIFVLEANPNPDIAWGEEFAESADAAGVSYDRLLQRIVALGLRYDPESRFY